MPTVGEAAKSTKQTPPPTRPKRRYDTPPQASTSQGAAASEPPAEKAFFGFHPLRSLRNIFFGYRRRERPGVGVAAAAGPKAKSTDDLDTTKQGNASLTKQQARKSCPFNKQMSLSADNLIDPDQLTMAWHPAPADSYTPTTTAVATTTGNAATTSDNANDKKIGIISEEEDWTAEFFTEKWTIESRERVPSSSDGMRGSTEDLDAIGSNCHNLDVSVARNKLAVKQKGKRMSTAFLQKGQPANARDALSSVAESEHEEKEKEATGSQLVSRANSSAKPSVAHSDDDLYSSDAVQSAPVAPIRVKRASSKSKAVEISPGSESLIVDSTQVTATEVAPAANAESTKEADSRSISIMASSAAVAPAIDANVSVDSADANLATASSSQAIALAVSSIPAVLSAICPSKSLAEPSGRHSSPGAPHCRKSAMETSGSLSAVETSAPGDAVKPPREGLASGGGEQGTSSPSCRSSLRDSATAAAKQPQDPNSVLHDDATFEENQRIYARLKKQEFSPVVKGKHRKKSPDGEGAAGGKRPAS